MEWWWERILRWTLAMIKVHEPIQLEHHHQLLWILPAAPSDRLYIRVSNRSAFCSGNMGMFVWGIHGALWVNSNKIALDMGILLGLLFKQQCKFCCHAVVLVMAQRYVVQSYSQYLWHLSAFYMANTALSVSCQANLKLTLTKRTFLCHHWVQSYKKHENAEIPAEFKRADMSALCCSPWSLIFCLSLGSCLSVCLAFCDLVFYSLSHKWTRDKRVLGDLQGWKNKAHSFMVKKHLSLS